MGRRPIAGLADAYDDDGEVSGGRLGQNKPSCKFAPTATCPGQYRAKYGDRIAGSISPVPSCPARH